MGLYKPKNSRFWWFKLTWRGELIRESTKQTNKAEARKVEAAYRVKLANGEAGIFERKPVPTLAQFTQTEFLPFVESTFAAKPKTLAYYRNGAQNLLAFDRIAGERLDAITSDRIGAYVSKRQTEGLQISSINRELQVLRRMFALAQEWRRVETPLPKVKMLSGENHRERVLTQEEEAVYLANATPLLRDIATLLLDCGLRPEEAFRLRWEHVHGDVLEILDGKTENARRSVPVSPRVFAILEMRRTYANSQWVFPSATKSGHVEPSTIKKPHVKACRGDQVAHGHAAIAPFPLYTFRHTCLTRWAPHMDPWTLSRLAGHKDMSITRRYVHVQADTARAAVEKARSAQSGHISGHSSQIPAEPISLGEALIQ